MRRAVILVVVLMFSCDVVSSQKADHISGGRFLKKIEYNAWSSDYEGICRMDILDNKSTLDKVFFGKTNSYVEFLFETSFEGVYGLRIIQDSSKSSYKLETMYMSEPDFREMRRILSRYENPILIPYELMDSIPMKVKTLINQYNKNRPRFLDQKNIYESYRPKTMSMEISGSFAEKLYNKLFSLINKFKTEDMPRGLILDGESVTFRCVVGNELWTLDIYCPQKKALKLSEICVQIVKDTENGDIDQYKYIKLLDEIK